MFNPNPWLLDKWAQYGNILLGKLYNHPQFSPGEWVHTHAILFIDINNMEAECKDGKYKLGEPGTQKEYEEFFKQLNKDLLPKEQGLIVDDSTFLRPRG